MSAPTPQTPPSTTNPDGTPVENPSGSTNIGPGSDDVIELTPDPLIDPNAT